jgi:hypothetical protein
MTREELDELLGTYEPMTDERLHAIRATADTDESVIPLLCETWGRGRQPFDLIRNQAAWFVGVCWMIVLIYFYEPTSQVVSRYFSQGELTFGIGALGVVFFLHLSTALMEVVYAKYRAAKAQDVIAAIQNPDSLGILLSYCYWTNSGDDKILIHPAVLAVNRLIKERPDFFINLSDKTQVDTVRRLLSRQIDLHSKRRLIFRLLRILGRDEAVDFLPEIRELTQIYNDTELRNAARRCLTHLEQAAERRKLEFTLLRAVDQLVDDAHLLRPATGGKRSDENLLITVEKGE